MNPVVELNLDHLKWVDHTLEQAVIKIYGRVVDSIVVHSKPRFEYGCAFFNVKYGDTRVVESPLAIKDTAFFFFQGEMVARWNFSEAFGADRKLRRGE